jgi:hypothetical protein
MSKDKQNTQYSQNIFDEKNVIIPINNRIFYPNWDNEPPPQPSIISVNETQLLTTGGILCICAKPGVGKSSICEAILSKHINSESDGLGFNVSTSKSILYIDTERSQSETWNSWQRMMKRAKIERPNTSDKVIYANYKALELKAKKTSVESILNENQNIGIIVFDGAGDFTSNTNDIEQANDFISWLNTFNPSISFVFTIHTNPSDNKPRGHLGSEICRRANSVLLANKHDGGLIKITSAFSDGKVRHGSDITMYYQWDDEFEMFMSSNDTPEFKKPPKDQELYNKILTNLFENKEFVEYKNIIEAISKILNKPEATAKTRFSRDWKNILVKKDEFGWVRI